MKAGKDQKNSIRDESLAAGGQAVIEGVLMRSKNTAIAVRRPDKSIAIKKIEKPMLIKRYKFLGIPFIRGVFVLWDALFMGINALSYSAQVSSEGTGEDLSKKEIIFSILIAFAFGIAIFVIAPLLLTGLFPAIKNNGGLFALVEGIIRTVFLIIYIWLVSFSKDIKRVFEYHGAEHKTVNAYEAGKELTMENAKKFSVIHPRCGTSFLVITMIAAIIVLTVAGFLWPLGFWGKLAIRLAFIPIIASVSYEFQRFTAKHLNNPFFYALATPGMWLQRLTTAEPDDEQIYVALVSLKSAVGLEVSDEELLCNSKKIFSPEGI